MYINLLQYTLLIFWGRYYYCPLGEKTEVREVSNLPKVTKLLSIKSTDLNLSWTAPGYAPPCTTISDEQERNNWKGAINIYLMLKKNFALLGKYWKSEGQMLAGLDRLFLHVQAFLCSLVAQTLIWKGRVTVTSDHKRRIMMGGGGSRGGGGGQKKPRWANGGSVIFSSYAKNIHFTTQIGSIKMQELFNGFCT